MDIATRLDSARTGFPNCSSTIVLRYSTTPYNLSVYFELLMTQIYWKDLKLTLARLIVKIASSVMDKKWDDISKYFEKNPSKFG